MPYVKLKSKKFRTKGEADEWSKKEKRAYAPISVLRIDINRLVNPVDGFNWEAILMRKEK